MKNPLTSRILSVASFAVVIAAASIAQVQALTLSWTANTESDLAGYRIFRSNTSMLGMTAAQAIANSAIVKTQVASNQTSLVVSGLAPGTYFFRMSAYDTSGNESILNVNSSNVGVEVSTTISTVGQAQVTGLITDASGANVTITGAGQVLEFDYGDRAVGGYASISAFTAGSTSFRHNFTWPTGTTWACYRTRGTNGIFTEQQCNSVTPGTGANPKDVNGDGSVNVTDVQLAVNQALVIVSCGSGDVNRDGACNVVDVQMVVNGALGL